MRYADDYVAGFQYKSDAQAFMREMPERLQKFHLSVEPTKTGMQRFSRHDVSGSKGFDFLGFTFRWKYDRHGRPHVGRETAKKKFAASLQAFTAWIRRARSWPRRMLFASLKRELTGYANYYGVPGNSNKLQAMWYQLYLLLFKWLNRCSQRRSYTMTGLTQALQAMGLTGFRIKPRNASKPRRPFLWHCS